MTPIEYDQCREQVAKKLNVRLSTLDEEVGKLRTPPADNRLSLVEEIEPWESPINGIELAKEIESLLSQHVILPKGAQVALTLWTMGTFVYDAFRVWPKLTISSPEKRCGKTTLLEVLAGQCHRSLVASNISPAAIYRVIEAWEPSLLIDEADTFIQGNDELRGVVNSGHTKSSAFVVRVTGDNHEPSKFSTWCPMVLSMIKLPPDTILDRSVVIQLRRKLPGEFAKKLPLSFFDDCYDLRRKLKRWGDDHLTKLRYSKPTLPPSQNDRALDNWMPLFAIADVLGGDWPERTRDAFQVLTLSVDEESFGPLILNDIKIIFDDKRADRIFSAKLVQALTGLEDRPWQEWRKGKPLTGAGLARLLKPFGIKSGTIRIGDLTQKGYYRKAFEDAFERYIQPSSDD